MNCLIVDDDELSRKTMEHFIKETPFLTLIKSCTSAIEAVNLLNDKPNIQLIFLDIEMPVMNGIDLLKHFSHRPQIILITSHKNYAIEAFEYDVADYLLKPVTYARYMKAVQKVVKNTKEDAALSNSTNEDIFIKVDSVLVKLSVKDILWLEAMGDYVSINTAEKKYIVYSTMKHMEEKLPENFMRVHRSHIVNIKKITNIEDYFITISKKILPVSRNYKDALIQKLNLV
ncbi:MAG TPA: LytTR family DNA-binding domain-containing protein [Cytophagaceae bacterium]|jgi:DNA-binding LytR/AlgR family response regulator|nr:LytTR family DNA-binding domain-containing protein [Cytophagaceae bacterium]